MIIRNFQILEDGSVTFESEMTAEENATLIEYAIVGLINSGHINLEEPEDMFNQDNKETLQ